jgi:hypothetical protein
VVTDTGRACIIPEQLMCTCEDGEPCAGPIEHAFDCSGVLSPEVEHPLEVWLGPGHGDSWDIECAVEEVGDHELLVTASFRWKKDQDADGEPDVVAHCNIPPLTEGIWEIRYGEGFHRFSVGPEVQWAGCIDSGRER